MKIRVLVGFGANRTNRPEPTPCKSQGCELKTDHCVPKPTSTQRLIDTGLAEQHRTARSRLEAAEDELLQLERRAMEEGL